MTLSIKIRNVVKRVKNKYRFVNEVNHCKAMMRNGFYGPSKTLFLSDITDGYILKDDIYTVRNTNSLFASVSTASFNTFVGTVEVPYIAKDSYFDALPKQSRQFILEHELHHFNHQKEELLIANGERLLELEIEADKAAAEKVGYDVAIMTLDEMKNIAMGIVNEKELDIRIDALRKSQIEYILNM